MATQGQSVTGRQPQKRKFGAEAITVAFSRVVLRSATFLTGVVVARVLGPDGRGLVAALTVPTNLSASLAEMGVRQSTAFHVGGKHFDARAVVATLLAALPIAALLSVSLSLLYFQLTHIAEGDWVTRLLAVAVVPFTLGIAYVTGVLLGRGNIISFSRASWIPSVTAFIMVCITIWWLGWGVRGVLLGTALGYAAGFCFALFVLSRQVPLGFRLDMTVLGPIQKLGMTYALATLAMLLNYKLMILLLTRLGTLENVGHYAQAAAIAEMLWEVPTMVSNLLFSRAVNASRKEEMSRKILAFLRLALVIVSAGAIVIGIAAPSFFSLVYGARFRESGYLCTLLLPGVVAFVAYRILQTDLHSRGLARYSLMIILPTLAVNTALGVVMIELYGTTGAAIASSTTYVLAAIAYTLMYSRLTGIRLIDIVRYRADDYRLFKNALPTPLKRFVP